MTYECLQGFTLDQSTSLTCLSDQSWGGAQPKCSRKSQEFYNENDSNKHSNCMFLMPRQVESMDILACLNTAHLLYFVGIECGNPGPVANGSVSGGIRYGDRVTYRCDTGHQLSSGNDVRLCQADQTWTGVKPTCSRMLDIFITLIQTYIYHCAVIPE